MVFDVVKMFPCLATNKWVSDVFLIKLIISTCLLCFSYAESLNLWCHMNMTLPP